MLRAIYLIGVVLALTVPAIMLGCAGGGGSSSTPSSNTAPTASFTVTPSSGTTATSFAVDASACTDAEDAASALQVRWDWESNGTWTAYSTTKTASHTFSTTGSHTITLQVKDSGGTTATTTHTVTVDAPAGDTAPTASFTVAPTSGTTATAFAMDASGCSDAQDMMSALQVQWDWESTGTWTAYTTTKTASHTFTTAGTKTITMRVKDTGGMTATMTQTVTVTSANTAPTASFTVTPSSGTTTTSFAVDASGCTDGQDAMSALQVQWDWESTGTWTAYTTTKTASHTFATAGTKTISVRVKDTGGLTATTTHSVTVSAPSGAKLTVSLDASQNGSGTTKASSITGAELLNTSGTVVSTATMSGGAAQFDLSSITAGSYFIRVNNLADDLVPAKIDSTSANLSQYIGNTLQNSVIGTLADPTYRIKTFSLGQSQHAIAKYSNGTAATPARYGYVLLSMKTSPQKMETRVLGTAAVLMSGSPNHHAFPSWILGSSNHGVSYSSGGNCSGCHGNLDTHPTSYSSVSESNGWCYRCHYGKNGPTGGFVDPTQ